MRIHVGSNTPGQEPEDLPQCFSDAEGAARALHLLLHWQEFHYLDRCETPCRGAEQCHCGACACRWCALSRQVSAAHAGAEGDAIRAALTAGEDVRLKFTAPDPEASEEIWAVHIPRACEQSGREDRGNPGA
ncbi:hypothetical protein [Streptomyces tsukubensis]|uniref:hypothetical protein n=1 Tax=Streptomyces tsukubensis TaxID=83656 RepID=UPI00344DE113